VRLIGVEQAMRTLSTKDEIATAVAAKVADKVADGRQLSLSGWQRLGALITGGLLIADALKGLFS
jgi:hypothetical protein